MKAGVIYGQRPAGPPSSLSTWAISIILVGLCLRLPFNQQPMISHPQERSRVQHLDRFYLVTLTILSAHVWFICLSGFDVI